MKIITWNCNMAFRKKFPKVIDLNPDILVLQECENDQKLAPFLEASGYNQLIWYGDNPHKGVAVLSFHDYHIELNENHDPEFKYILPLKLTHQDKSVNLFTIWAMPHDTVRSKNYVVQIWGAINHYTQELDAASILIGDFNSNTIWDHNYKVGNHTALVEYLKEKHIISLYHDIHHISHGEEPDPTLYLLKKEDRPYHIDYCFVSQQFLTKKTTIIVGNYNEWIKLSDHMPVIIDHLSV